MRNNIKQSLLIHLTKPKCYNLKPTLLTLSKLRLPIPSKVNGATNMKRSKDRETKSYTRLVHGTPIEQQTNHISSSNSRTQQPKKQREGLSVFE